MQLKQKGDIPRPEDNPYAAPGAAPPSPAGHEEVALPVPGNGVRFVAFVIDIVIVYAVVLVLAFGIGVLKELMGAGDLSDLLDGIYLVSAVGLPIAYHTLLEGSALQASVGKLAMGLRVVHDQTGERLGYGRSFLRALVRGMLSFGWIFWLVVLLSKKRQGLWDMLAKSRVVQR